jgi:hypothetical protein
VKQEQLSTLRAHFFTRNLVFWAGNRGKKGRGMFITPNHIWWAPVTPYFECKAHKCSEEVVREVSKILIDLIHGADLADFQVGSVGRALMFLSWSEQWAVLQILKTYYVKQQPNKQRVTCTSP